jgi:hypothetical protein
MGWIGNCLGWSFSGLNFGWTGSDLRFPLAGLDTICVVHGLGKP